MQKQNNKKSETGITLIALVVSIIVLIILAGVSIAMLVGENGIITQAQRAAQETEIKGDEEKIRLAINAVQIENNGNLNIEKADLEKALLENGTKSIVVDKEDGTRNIIFLDSKKIYKLNNNGSIEDTNSDFDSIYVAPDSQDDPRNEGVIGIGTDGQPVDMDLWEYTLYNGSYVLNDITDIEDTEGINETKGYLGEIVNGEIQGAVPQYIKTKTDTSFIEVTNMKDTFLNIDNLIIAPYIPNTVTDMQSTFSRCSNLTDVTHLSNQLVNMKWTFFECSSLEELKVDLPKSVKYMVATFNRCSNLKKAPIIPENVEIMHATFIYCSKLKTATTIPESVKILSRTFVGCSSLEGVLEINANIDGNYSFEIDGVIYEGYEECFLDACIDGSGLIIKGTCTKLNELRDNNQNITIE